MQYPGAEIPITNQESALTGLISRQRPIILGVGLSHRPVIPTRYFRLYLKVIRSSVPKELGFFTSGGHFIVLRGVTAGGKVLVNDPNDSSSKNYINREFDMMTEVHATANAYWIFAKK